MNLENRLPTLCLLGVFAPVTFLLWQMHWMTVAAVLAAFCVYLLLCLVLMPETSFAFGQRLRFGPLAWAIEDFRRHWIIIGKSGCGKTLAFFKTLIIQLCLKVKNWGGVAIDEKGDFWQLTTKIFKALGMASKLIVVRVRKPGDTVFVPTWKMNLIGDRSVPWDTWAQIVTDVAVSQGQKSTNPHFKTQARLRIRDTFTTLACVGLPVTLSNAYEFLKFPDQQAAVLELLMDMKESSQDAADLVSLWTEFFKIDPGELSGIKTTAEGYLAPYAAKEIAEVFCCPTPNLDFKIIDQGYVLSQSIPQAFLTQRSYCIAFFKMLFYYHGLRRFDESGDYIEKANDLVLLADEGHSSLLPSEEGMSDLKSLDKLRAAKCTCVFGMQDYASAAPHIGGKERAMVFFANTGNHVIFAINTSEGRKIAADIIDKEMRPEDTTSCDQSGRESISRRKTPQYIFHPHEFKRLKKFSCVIQHCEGPHAKTVLPPLTDDGKKVESWFFWVRVRSVFGL